MKLRLRFTDFSRVIGSKGLNDRVDCVRISFVVEILFRQVFCNPNLRIGDSCRTFYVLLLLTVNLLQFERHVNPLRFVGMEILP